MVELVVRVVLSLAVVLGLFWMVARTGSRKMGGRDRSLLRVRSRQALSRGSSLAVVEVGSRVLVVGVSDGGIRLLAELDPEELAAPETGARKAALDSPDPDDAGAEVVPPVRDSADFPAFPGFPALPGHEDPYAARLVPDEAYGPDYVAAYEPDPSVLARTIAAHGKDIPSARRPGERAVGGSLLDTGVWRDAWAAATGRQNRDGDAA